MEKNLYETYKFLPGTDENADEFFVVQNDGTLLINRQVQYVTEVDNVKGVLENVQPCTAVYDVSSQQYYVDVDNSTGLISVSDQFVLPQDATHSEFGNNYLLQTIPSISESSVQLAETVAGPSEYNETKKMETIDPSTMQGPETTNFTEITLNAEQYRALEVKGWVLLDMGGKAYLLNTLGLHDITENEKLLKDLRNDAEAIEPTLQGNVTNGSNSYEFEEIMTTIGTKEEGPVPQEILLGSAVADVECKDELGTEISQGTPEPSNLEPVTSNAEQTAPAISSANADRASTHPDGKKPSMIVRLQTNLFADDIPNKIVLGNTPNGKRLVAKVRRIKKPAANKEMCSENNTQDPDGRRKSAPVVTQTLVNKSNKEAFYKAKEVDHLIQKHIASPTELNSSADDVKSAEMIIKQLLNVPATRTPMVERNLIITKIVKTMKDPDNQLSESKPTLVTGRVAQFDEKGEWHFIYIPYLLQKLRNHCSDESGTSPTDMPTRHVFNSSSDDYILHVHVLEIKCPKVPTKTYITFSKKRIKPELQVLTNKAIFACSACAKIFANEQELTDHHESECMEAEDEKPPLIIDTDKISKQPIKKNTHDLAKNGAPCVYCNAKRKLSNQKRHLQSHIGPMVKGASSGKANEDGSNKGLSTAHKCKMCSTPYYHASTLSKHILSQHIQSNICMF